MRNVRGDDAHSLHSPVDMALSTTGDAGLARTKPIHLTAGARNRPSGTQQGAALR